LLHAPDDTTTVNHRNADAQGVWDDIEDGTHAAPAITVQRLIERDPDNVISWIAKSGVAKLGEFKVQVWGCAVGCGVGGGGAQPAAGCRHSA
jgi:hypothetical protein